MIMITLSRLRRSSAGALGILSLLAIASTPASADNPLLQQTPTPQTSSTIAGVYSATASADCPSNKDACAVVFPTVPGNLTINEVSCLISVAGGPFAIILSPTSTWLKYMLLGSVGYGYVYVVNEQTLSAVTSGTAPQLILYLGAPSNNSIHTTLSCTIAGQLPSS
jgi:hypothetical protein